MSEATSQQQQAAQSVNGQASAAGDVPDAESPYRVTGGERALAVLAIIFGLFVIVIGIDMASGGRVTGYVSEVRGDNG